MSNPAPPNKKGPKPQFTLENGLTVREDRFVDEYLLDFNATKAARRAKYSEKNARQIGHQVLHRPEVMAAITARIAERSARTKIDTSWVVQQLIELHAEALADNNMIVAKSCLEQLGRHTGGFKSQLELSGGFTLDVVGARDRIRDKLARADAAKRPPVPPTP
jgi:phage terminase small subunit